MNAKNELQRANVITKSVVKLMRAGGVAELSTFSKFERARLARSSLVRVARFSSTGPVMAEITAEGWKHANSQDWAGRFGI